MIRPGGAARPGSSTLAKSNYARLCKSEQRDLLRGFRVGFWTARTSDIGREAGLGRAVSLLSPASVIWGWGTIFLSNRIDAPSIPRRVFVSWRSFSRHLRQTSRVPSYINGTLVLSSMRTNFAARLCFLVCAAHTSAQSAVWRLPSRGIGDGRGLAGRRRSRASDDGCDRHSHWRGLHETSYFDPLLSFRGHNNFRTTIVYYFARRSRKRRSRDRKKSAGNSSSVRNGTAWNPSRCQDHCMRRKKPKKEPLDATRASVKREMARPRMAKSARITQRSLERGRTPKRPSTSMPGTVDKIIPAHRQRQPEKAQIGVERAARRHRSLRIENTLTDENGDEVKLKKGAHVEVTVEAEDQTSTAKIKNDS